ncbi:MAG: DUF4253 domain-containing protein, partial [Anaerolineae bacterium]|nr:DUF4253 domain-containing protein [Anaerolineae bacterium]
DWRPDDDDLDFYLTQSPVAQDLGLTVVDVHRALGPAPDELAFERWLLDTELNHGAGPKSSDAWYLEWFVPPDVTMVLLPRSEPWAAGAYIGGYVWGYPHTDIRTAVLRRWHQRHGAEPAANWGTMLQFVVSRPPTNIEEAWVVAYETKILWPDTAGGANGIATRQHAWDLLGRDRWFVHYRP